MKSSELSETGASESLEKTVERFAKSKRGFCRAPDDSERRAKPRVQERFPARIWGVDSGDLPFNFECVIDNISSTGLYLRMPRPMPKGGEVRLVVHLLSGPTSGASARISGEILRDELQPDGKHGIAVAIKDHKFL
jgi:hypothetical protein